MSEDANIEIGKGLESDFREMKTRTVGRVSGALVDEVVSTIREVFNTMGYNGELPEVVSVSQGAVLLPSGEEIEACYSYDKPKVPGRIYISTERSKSAFGRSSIPIEVASAAFAAHEAVEHVNHMRGRTLLSSNRRLKPEEHKTETEDEANRIARKVIERRYNWRVRFGDENV